MKHLREETRGNIIPNYMQDILTNNYCPFFMRMSMIREDDSFIMNYQTDRLSKLEISRLNTKEKLILLRSLIILIEKNQEWLIGIENYLIEPQYIYSINNCVYEDSIKILFYPDASMSSFSMKIVNFSKKIRRNMNYNDVEIFIQFEKIAFKGDVNRMKLFLDKNILRMETEIQNVV